MFQLPPLARPLQWGLMLGTSLTAVALLKPQPLPRSPAASSEPALATMETPRLDAASPWVRAAAGPWVPPREAPPVRPPTPRLPEPVALLPQQPTVDVPLVPEPGVRYIGHMEREGRSYAFFANGDVPAVVEVGGLLDAQWRLVGLTAQQAELLHLPSNASRVIALISP